MRAKFSKLTDEDEGSKRKLRSSAPSTPSSKLTDEDLEGIMEIEFHSPTQHGSVLGSSSNDLEKSLPYGGHGGHASDTLREYCHARRSFIKGAMLVFTMCVVPLIIVIIILSSLLADEGADSESTSSTSSWTAYETSTNGLYGAVATDTGRCSEIAQAVLQKGGNAIEAAIAAAFCLGVISPTSSGIGGGCYMLIHNATTGANEFIDSREVAPALAKADMFAADPMAAQRGALAIAVLGEVKGLELAYNMHSSGNVSWSELVLPAAALARRWTMSDEMGKLILHAKAEILSGNFSLLQQLYTKNGRLKVAGDIVEQPELAETLTQIAAQGSAYLYEVMADTLAQEISSLGGIVSGQDIKSFAPLVRPALETNVSGFHFVSVGGSSSGGVVVAGILKFMSSLPVPLASMGNTYYHWLVEAMKHAFAMRLSLGDPDYVNTTAVSNALLSDDYMASLAATSYSNQQALDIGQYGGEYNYHHIASQEDHGTSHLSVVDRWGNAVSMTSTVNTYFGSKIISPSTGILFNNQMDDFSIPGAANYFGLAPSPYNYPEPGKKPLSSMSPCFVLDCLGRVRLAGGGSGGPRIITATAQVCVRKMLTLLLLTL